MCLFHQGAPQKELFDGANILNMCPFARWAEKFLQVDLLVSAVFFFNYLMRDDLTARPGKCRLEKKITPWWCFQFLGNCSESSYTGHNSLRRWERNLFYEDGYCVRHVGKTLENVTFVWHLLALPLPWGKSEDQRIPVKWNLTASRMSSSQRWE